MSSGIENMLFVPVPAPLQTTPVFKVRVDVSVSPDTLNDIFALADLLDLGTYPMFLAREITLADLFLLFIYAEIIGMVGVFYSTNRIPVTLPIIIAITALCRLIIMQSKDMDALMLVGEAAAILILSISAYIMSLKDKLSIEKDKTIREEDN